MLRNTRETYGLATKVLHWATAGLILILLPLGFYMHELPETTTGEVAFKVWCYSAHKTLGVAVFVLAVVRVAWSLSQPRPRPVKSHKPHEILLAQTVHWTLYVSIICMPLTGWLHHAASTGFAPIWWPLPQGLPFVEKDPDLARFFGTAHFTTGILLATSVALHIAGALKHLVIDKDGTVRRMLTGIPPAPTTSTREPRFDRLPAVLALLAAAVTGTSAVVLHHVGEVGNHKTKLTISAEPANASGWQVDHSNSKLTFQIVQMGSKVTGSFENWSANVVFDPANLANASVEVEVDVASVSLGGLSKQAKGPNFLNAPAHPVARFVARDFVRTGDKKFEAHGHLTLAGKQNPLILLFTLDIDNGRAKVEAQATIQRLSFGIGAKGFSGDKQLGFAVVVKIDLVANRLRPG